MKIKAFTIRKNSMRHQLQSGIATRALPFGAFGLSVLYPTREMAQTYEPYSAGETDETNVPVQLVPGRTGHNPPESVRNCASIGKVAALGATC